MSDTTRSRPEESEQSDLTEGLRKMVVPKGLPEPFGTDAGVAGASTSEAGLRYSLPGRPPPPPVPNGWYAIAGSSELATGELMSRVAVERDLIAYRDEDGDAHVMDAHCPHLGAHLGGGRVVGDTVKCPYHGWHFGPDGTCTRIPYSDARIPPRACVKSYPVNEQDGFIFFWFHAGGKDPDFEVPRVVEASDPEWSEPHVWETELVAALQEMAENNVDYAHLRYVHRRPFVPNETSEFMTDGPFSTVIEQLPDGQEFMRHAWGPGVAVLRVPDLMTVFTTTTPIDRRHCRLRWHFHFTKRVEKMAPDMIEGVTGGFGLQADIPIWRDKVFLERPVLVKADGNIAEFRRWYSQFYDDAAT